MILPCEGAQTSHDFTPHKGSQSENEQKRPTVKGQGYLGGSSQ